MHLLSAVTHCPDAAGLIDHPRTFPMVWSMIGWNVHIYHSHLDVHPPIRVQKPFRFEWRPGQPEAEPGAGDRPAAAGVGEARLLAVGRVREEGRGNLKVVPGGHRGRTGSTARRGRDVEWPEPEGAIEVQVAPGDGGVLRPPHIRHAQSEADFSDITRKAIFFGYTLRWIAIRDELEPSARQRGDRESLKSPSAAAARRIGKGIQASSSDHPWGRYPDTTPVYNSLKELDLLDPSNQTLPVTPMVSAGQLAAFAIASWC